MATDLGHTARCAAMARSPLLPGGQPRRPGDRGVTGAVAGWGGRAIGEGRPGRPWQTPPVSYWPRAHPGHQRRRGARPGAGRPRARPGRLDGRGGPGTGRGGSPGQLLGRLGRGRAPYTTRSGGFPPGPHRRGRDGRRPSASTRRRPSPWWSAPWVPSVPRPTWSSRASTSGSTSGRPCSTRAPSAPR